jgi:hypothetical protein
MDTLTFTDFFVGQRFGQDNPSIIAIGSAILYLTVEETERIHKLIGLSLRRLKRKHFEVIR